MYRFTLPFAAVLFTFASFAIGGSVAPPQQPTDGPGGSNYTHGDLTVHAYGDGDSRYWIFEPADPKPATAPVIIFCHGWSGMSPNDYGAWIKHLVRRGNIVIYPRYQASIKTPMKAFTPNAEAAVKAAFHELATGDHVKPQLDHVAVAGHSMGGAIAPNLAVLMPADGLPTPTAICSMHPGNKVIGHDQIFMPFEDFSKIPAATLVLMITGQDDKLVKDETAKEIYGQMKTVAKDNKNFVTLVSDDHGDPKVNSGHMAPVSVAELVPPEEKESSKPAGPIREKLRERMKEKSGEAGAPHEGGATSAMGADAMDFYGYWKLFDALTDAAFYGKNREFALGNTPQQRFMGKWSDGVPVKELIVSGAP